MIKKNIIGILFFSAIIISSCITFNNQKNIEHYDYDQELLISNANFWGTPVLHTPTEKLAKENGLLALFKHNRLQHIVSNDYRHYHRYNYIKINDTTNILVSQENRMPVFARYDDIYIDSILFTANHCIIKRGNFTRHGNSRNIYITVYSKDTANITQYYYAVENKNPPNIDLRKIPLTETLLYLKPEHYNKIKVNLTINKKTPIYSTGKENAVDSFFRYQIMQYGMLKNKYPW